MKERADLIDENPSSTNSSRTYYGATGDSWEHSCGNIIRVFEQQGGLLINGVCYLLARDYEVREHIPHTWVSSNDSFFNLILARGHTAPLF